MTETLFVVHNPQNVLVQHLPKGWRFLYPFEIRPNERAPQFRSNEMRMRRDDDSGWHEGHYCGNSIGRTYCTSLTPEQLRERRRKAGCEWYDFDFVKIEPKPEPNLYVPRGRRRLLELKAL